MKTDLTGRQFGKLTVLSLVEYRPHSKSKWLCMCECGNTHIVSHSNLVGGNVKTCGCGKIIGKMIHGGKGTRLYRIWRNMKSRCTLPSTINFQKMNSTMMVGSSVGSVMCTICCHLPAPSIIAAS